MTPYMGNVCASICRLIFELITPFEQHEFIDALAPTPHFLHKSLFDLKNKWSGLHYDCNSV